MISQHEKRLMFNQTHLSKAGYTVRNRALLVDWMREFSNDHHLDNETYHLSVLLLDRFLVKRNCEGYSKDRFQLIAMTCLMIAIKQNVCLRMVS